MRQRRRGAAYRVAAATSGRGIPRRGSDVGARGIPRRGSDVGARHTATRQRRRGAAYRDAAATSGHGMPCPDPDTSPPFNPLWEKGVGR
ncbi:hypothetical protein RoseRS_3022 [Roseiflexus sp. RS-1]|nr:hypothetical protein RoseRS_3022 [Roseiflexus sp. RS-1]